MKKFGKWLIRGTTFLLVGGATLVGTYLLVPNKTRVIRLEDSGMNQDTLEDTYFDKFVSKLAASATGESEEPLGLSATLTDFEITWPTKDESGLNDIKLDGALNLKMSGLQDINFTLDVAADYNGKGVSLGVGLVDGDFFFAFQDLRIKSSHSSTEDLLMHFYDLFLNPDNPDGLGLDLDIQELVDELMDGIDLNSLLANLSMPNTTETITDDEVIIDLEMDGIALTIIVDKETADLKKVDLGELKVGNATIKGCLDCSFISEIIPLDSPDYPVQRGEFVESINYIGWLNRLLDLFDTRQLGLDFSASVALAGQGDVSKLVDLAASINIDFSNIFDFNTLKFKDLEEIPNEEEEVEEAVNEENPELKPLMAANDEMSSLDKLKSVFNPNGGLEFGVHVSANGQGNDEYMNLDLSYFDNIGYLTLNEKADSSAVMRAKIEKNTVSSLIEKIPGLIALVAPAADNTVKNNAEVEAKSDSLFSFITDSALVSAIKNGEYSGIVDVIKNISNDNEKINLALDLSSLGLGNNAEVDLVIDSNLDNKVVDLGIKDCNLGGVLLDADLVTTDFTEMHINKVKEKAEEYDSMSFVDDVIDQTSSILNVKTGKLTLTGSILDENKEGVYITDGVANFDANKLVGYGSINLRQKDSNVKNKNGYIDHRIDFDINNDSSSETERNMLFAYNKDLKAKISTTTVSDVFNLFTDLLGSNDERFTKFGGSILEMLLGSTIANIIASKDYLEFAKSSYLTSIKQTNGGNTIEVSIAGDVLGLESDIVIGLNFKKDANGKKMISGLSINDLAILGKTVNINATLEELDETYVSPINKGDNFLDFTQVKVLLDFGINTTKINYYHLSADVVLYLSKAQLLTVKLDFHIHVDGKVTKVYGSIPKVPWLSDIMSQDLGSTSINSEFVFEPVDDIGGIFHIVRNENHALWGKDQVVYYRTTSKNFLDGILDYLLGDMLNLKVDKIEGLGNINLGSSDKDPDFSKLFGENGFVYTKDESTGKNNWYVNVNLGPAVAIDALKELTISLNGKDDVNGSGLFTDADISLNVSDILTVKVKLILDSPSFEVKAWPDSIEAKYQKVLDWYNNLPQPQKDDFDENYMNHPDKGYVMINEVGYF